MLILLLGSHPELSLREAQSVYPDVDIERVGPQTALITKSGGLDPQEIINRLAGSIKCLKVIETLEDSSAETAQNALKKHLLELGKNGKFSWSIAEIGRDHLPKIEPFHLKASLAEAGISSRFVTAPRSGASAALLTHQDVTEVAIVSTSQGIFLAQTQAVQDIDEWSFRDRSRPVGDHRRGMLPPKVARMMLNIAIGSNNPSTQVVADPFCGMGTILAEAALLGVPKVVASDLDQEAINGTRANLNWLLHHYNLPTEVELQTADATHVLWTQKPTVLVTEPFLGKQTPHPQELANQFKGLEKLYWGALKNWARQLESGTSIMLITPQVTLTTPTKTKIFDLLALIDKAQELGYTTQSEVIEYARPNATVRRQIHHLQFKAQ